MMDCKTINCEDLNAAIAGHLSDGYRLDMIIPADDPHEALVSRDGENLMLVLRKPAREQGRNIQLPNYLLTNERASALDGDRSEWITGRAGMMYRDLIPDRLGGRLIASHIRIVEGGVVSDSVHYHKIDFQVIYCIKGAIRVVYEDQGEPFWLRPGDCVLQPPEIRHRVLEAEAGSEVIEITSPSVHETWFDHELELPTNVFDPNRIFETQRFRKHLNSASDWREFGEEEVLAAATCIDGVRLLASPRRSLTYLSVVRNELATLKIFIGDQGIEVTLPLK